MKNALTFPVIALALSLAQTSHAAVKKAVFVMTNAAHENEILSYSVQADGSLKAYSTYRTGGRQWRDVDPLGSQGSLTLSEDHSLLFAVNAAVARFPRFASMARNWNWRM